MKSCGLISLLFVALLTTANATSHTAGSAVMPAGCNRPNHVQLVAITDSTVTLTWHGNAERYDYLCVRQEDMAALNIVSQGVFVDDTTVTLTGLRPSGLYCFRVRGHCGQAASAWSQDFYFHTLCGPQRTPYSETFEACSGTGVSALPPCWNAFYVVNDTAFVQSGATNVYPVATPAIKGKKSLALKEEAVEGTLLSRKRCYAVMPMFALKDDAWQFSFDAVGMGSDTVRLVVGLLDGIENVGQLEAIDTMVLSFKKQHYDTLLARLQLEDRHIVFYNIGGLHQPMNDHYTVLIDNVRLAKPAQQYCPHPLVMVNNEDVTEQTARVKWNDVAGSYELQWKLQSSSTWSKSIPLSGAGYTLTGLKPNTKYTVRVRSVCKANKNKKYSEWVPASFITKSTPNCPYPYVTVGEDYITEQSALVAWDGENDSYELQWKEVSSSAWSNAVSLHEYSYVITGLKPETGYIVQVRGVCDGKDYSTWTPAVFTTKPMPEEPAPPVISTPTVVETQQPCPEVEGFRLARVGSSEALIEWQGRTNIYAIELVGYDEYHLPQNVSHTEVTIGTAATTPLSDHPQSYSHKLTELEPDNDYEVRVRTKCPDGRYGGWSEKVSFHTEDTADIHDTVSLDDFPIEEVIEDEVFYTLTEKGVDILQIGEPFVKNPPEGAIYDVADLTSKGDLGGLEYKLWRYAQELGYAIVSDGKLIGLIISHPNVMVEGGITVNTPIEEAFKKRQDVSSVCSWYFGFDEVYVELYFEGDKKILTYMNVEDLSSSGKLKYDKIYREGRNYNPFSDENMGRPEPSIEFEPSDFKKAATVKEFRVGQTLFMCW
ncbi:MAG: fibronectin type III domain-containing protein [Bacteroidales bacterium]|nr:fibronectin type III domain-containing protein [Bacteroidales bacterium]